MVQGKELSYNNIGDTEAAYECVASSADLRRRGEARQSLRVAVRPSDQYSPTQA